MQVTKPAMSGDLWMCRTSMGKAMVDILLPHIDTQEATSNLRNAGGPSI